MGRLQQVNPSARRAYAELLRQFASGRCTNFQYEDKRDGIWTRLGSDAAMHAIADALWHTYCDLHERLWDGDVALRARVARWVVFLHSDNEMGVLPRAGHRAWIRCCLLVVYVLGSICTFGSCLLGATAVALTSGVFTGLAWGLLWITGVSIAPRVFQAAFVDDPNDCWPFPSQETQTTALRTPLLLSGGQNRYATVALG